MADSKSLLYEPAPAGLPHAREAISKLHGVGADRIFVTASTSESYSYLFKLLADPGDEVLVPRPSYPLFEFLATLESLVVRQYSLVYHEGWFIDFGSLRAAITPRTRAVVLVNPNNPTGSFLKREELPRLVELCARHRLTIISDEVFSDYRFDDDPSVVPTLSGIAGVPVFALSGLSKVLGLPQMKLGWMVLGGPEEERAAAFDRLELIADTYLSAGTPIQHAMPSLLRLREPFQRQLRTRLGTNLDLLRKQTAPSSCKVLRVEGGWYATIAVPRTRSEEEWTVELLDRDNVLVQPGFFFDFESESFLIVSLLTRESVFAEGIHRLISSISRQGFSNG
jgi:aspartate/methionine/tyrosine aminotransferase